MSDAVNNPNKKPLPAMKNVGIMTLGQLNKVIAQFPTDKVAVTRGEMVIKVADGKRGFELMSAACLANNSWHVRAREGLLSVTVNPH